MSDYATRHSPAAQARKLAMPADYWAPDASKARTAAAAKRRKEYRAKLAREWAEHCRSIGRLDLIPAKRT